MIASGLARDASPIRVEFYGLPRHLAGVEAAHVVADTLAEAVERLSSQFPALAATCFDCGRLQSCCAANLNGERFIVDPQTPLAPGDALLILSADAGG